MNIAEMDQLTSLLASLSMDGDQLKVLQAVRPAIGNLSRYMREIISACVVREVACDPGPREELRSGLAGKEVDLVPLFDCLHRWHQPGHLLTWPPAHLATLAPGK